MLYQYKEDASRDVQCVPLQSLSALFVFYVGRMGILEQDVLVISNLHNDVGSVGSQQSWLGCCVGNCGSTHVEFVVG